MLNSILKEVIALVSEEIFRDNSEVGCNSLRTMIQQNAPKKSLVQVMSYEYNKQIQLDVLIDCGDIRIHNRGRVKNVLDHTFLSLHLLEEKDV